MVYFFLSQGGEWFEGCHVAGLGHWDGSVFARSNGSRGGRALRTVWRPQGGQRGLWLYGESLGPWNRDLSAHTPGSHQQSLLPTGKHAHLHTQFVKILCYASFCFIGERYVQLCQKTSLDAMILEACLANVLSLKLPFNTQFYNIQQHCTWPHLSSFVHLTWISKALQ